MLHRVSSVPKLLRWLPDRQSLFLTLLAGVFFSLAYLAGYWMVGTSAIPLPSEEILAKNLILAKAELQKKLNLPATQLWKQIYPINLLAAILLLIIGIGTAGCYSVLFLLKMGFPLGVRLGEFVSAQASLSLYFWSLAPHGITELPAFCLLAAAGLRAGRVFLRYLNNGPGPSAQDRWECLKLSLWGLLLLSVSGILEAWCTPFFALQYL